MAFSGMAHYSRQLEGDCKAVLHVLVDGRLAGLYASSDRVAAAAGLSEADATEALFELRDLGLVRRSGDHLWRASTAEELEESPF